ncbi:MAG TPA: RNA polymerase sigma factor [Gemmatimonadaceae bacterium]|nr:RNA polymerase sigma factor [Gemmatimonadaceae bacterium]
MAAPSDEQLMLALRDGELSAFETLFRRHYESIRALSARMASVRDGGDDLAQETFLRILRYRATFRGDARFTTWAYRIARNVCLEHLARAARERRVAESWTAEGESATSPAGDGDEVAQLEAAMHALSPEHREVLVLCRYHGLPFTEISEILGCTPGAARVRAHRALLALRANYLALET